MSFYAGNVGWQLPDYLPTYANGNTMAVPCLVGASACGRLGRRVAWYLKIIVVLIQPSRQMWACSYIRDEPNALGHFDTKSEDWRPLERKRTSLIEIRVSVTLPKTY